MIKRLLTLALLGALPIFVNAQTQVLADTSMEVTGAGGADWSSTSTNFGTVLCDQPSCGVCGGPCAPHSGTWYAWFGGAGGPEVGTLSQTFNVSSAGIATLNFWLMIPAAGLVDDSLSAFLDGNLVWFKLGNDSVGFETSYALVTDSLGSITAGSHTLDWSGLETGVRCNFLVDDITINVDAGDGVSDFDFENGVTVYTNYSEHLLNCAFNFQQASDLVIQVTDQLGRTVRSSKLNNVKENYITFNTMGLSNGIYNITFIKEGSVFTKRIFIQE